jgi:O-antigen ligase
MVRTATLFFCSCIFIRYRFPAAYILKVFVAAMGLLLLLSLVAALATPIGVMDGFDAGRWRGIFNHKNTLGENAALTLVVAFGLYATRSRRDYWLACVATLAAGCLLMSGSATALASAGIGGLVFGAALAIVRLRIIRRQGFWLLLALIALLALVGYVLTGPVAALLGRDTTFTGRTDIWQQFLYFAHQRPWTGWGWATIATTDHMLPIIRQTLGLPYIQTPHSGYLSLVVELGYPGLLAFLIWLSQTVLGSSSRAIFGGSHPAMVQLAIACALIVHSLFESTSGALPSPWLLLLLAVDVRHTFRWR